MLLRQNVPAAGYHGDSYPLTHGSFTKHTSSNNPAQSNHLDILPTTNMLPNASNAAYFPTTPPSH